MKIYIFKNFFLFFLFSFYFSTLNRMFFYFFSKNSPLNIGFINFLLIFASVLRLYF